MFNSTIFAPTLLAKISFVGLPLYDPDGVTRNLRPEVTLDLTLYPFFASSSPNLIFYWLVKPVKHTSSPDPFTSRLVGLNFSVVFGDLELNESMIFMSMFVALYPHRSDTKRSPVKYESSGALCRLL